MRLTYICTNILKPIVKYGHCATLCRLAEIGQHSQRFYVNVLLILQHVWTKRRYYRSRAEVFLVNESML